MITMMFASDESDLIGNELEMPWCISSDFKHFKKYTTGKNIVMGRKTAESLGKPLPNRTNYVMTRSRTEEMTDGILHENGWVYIDHPDCLWTAENERQDFVIIGGAQIYKEFEQYADRILWTEVKGTHKGDIYFKLQEEWPNKVYLGEDPDGKCTFWELTR
tara:strand:+ start:6743 stop:7225 length:483 start_codon:yes stop_codon:yes gene_type:complete